MKSEKSKVEFQLVQGSARLTDTTSNQLLWSSPTNLVVSHTYYTTNPERVYVGMKNKIQVLEAQGLIAEIITEFVVDGFSFTKQQGDYLFGYLESNINSYDLPIKFSLNTIDFSLAIEY